MTDETQPPDRIAESPEELARVLARTRLGPLLGRLDLARYFPRSSARALAEEHQSRAGMLAIEIAAGAVLAAAAISLWRLSPFPFAYAVALAIPALVLARRQMPSIYGATSEAQRFIELMAFDARAPVVYLRRFDGEDPPLPALRKRSAIGGATNPSGTDTLENLSQLLDAAGPVVGLGRPGDTSIGHRIWRLYTPDDHWRSVVQHLLGEAKAVLMSYEASPIIEWELAEAIKAELPALIVLVRGLPAATVRDEKAALAALPRQLKALGRTVSYHDGVLDRFRADEHGLLVVVAPGSVRVHGVKVHFQLLWDLLLREMVHTLRVTETRGFTNVPSAYVPLVHAVAGSSPWWDIAAVAGGAAALVYGWLVLVG